MKLTGRLLLIDDDPDLLNMLKVMLTVAGHRVTLAADWKQVVAALNQAAQASQAFDAIFLDLMMPERSGFDILRSLKVVLFPMPPVVVLTALNDLEPAVNALELGATKYLTKPVSKEKLLATVREVLAGRPASRF